MTVQGLDEHTSWLEFQGARPSTIGHRRRTVGRFASFLGEGREPLDATPEECLAWLGRAGLAPESRRCYRSHLKGYFAWAVDEGLVDTDPMVRIPPVRVPRKLPRPIPAERLAVAMDQADPRMRAWLRLMAYAGLRCMEVANLEPRDIELDPVPILRLRVTKGGKEATVPAHPTVLDSLARLPIQDGRWWTVGAATVSRLVNAHLRSLGFADTAHSLRHAAGTAFYEASGYDLITTQRLLRHASVQSTQIYADVSPLRPRQAMEGLRIVG